MPSTVQFDIFGGSVVTGAPRVFAMEPGEHDCPDRWCDNRQVPRIVGTTTEYFYDHRGDNPPDPEMGWEHDFDRRYSRELTQWVTCDRCQYVCGSCDEVHDRSYASECSNCESCESCCECQWCDRCEEPQDDRNMCGLTTRYGGYHCESCCECSSCDVCGDTYNMDDGPCCEDDYGNDSENVSVSVTYRPTHSAGGTRTFGVELEHTGIGPRRAAAVVNAAGIDCSFRGYTHDGCHAWKTVTDSSVSGGETVSAILCGEDGFHQLETVCDALTENGATVDSSCGTHVHIGCEDLSARDVRNVVRFYSAHQSLIDLIHAPSRRGEQCYCGPVTTLANLDSICATDDDDSHKLRRIGGMGKQHSNVNLSSLNAYGTIEFRQHAGSLNAEKLSAWVRFLFALVEAGRDNAPTVRTLPDLLRSLESYGLPSADAEYLRNRANDFANV